MPRRLGAELFCAFGLTFAGSDSAVLTAGLPLGGPSHSNLPFRQVESLMSAFGYGPPIADQPAMASPRSRTESESWSDWGSGHRDGND